MLSTVGHKHKSSNLPICCILPSGTIIKLSMVTATSMSREQDEPKGERTFCVLIMTHLPLDKISAISQYSKNEISLPSMCISMMRCARILQHMSVTIAIIFRCLNVKAAYLQNLFFRRGVFVEKTINHTYFFFIFDVLVTLLMMYTYPIIPIILKKWFIYDVDVT